MCQNRIKVLNEAFDLLDSDEDDYLTYDDFEFWFRSYHPNFVNRPPDEQLDKVSQRLIYAIFKIIVVNCFFSLLMHSLSELVWLILMAKIIR